MAISASMVKELRELTGAGMMDCKKVLTEANGDMEKAIELLREKGLAAAVKKAGRIAAEGMVSTCVSADNKKASIVEVNSETDFVAKNPDFRQYVANVATQALATTAADIDAFLAEEWALDNSKTVKEELSTKIAFIGENLNIRRFIQVETDGLVESYIHAGGKIGVLVELNTDVVNDAVKEIARNVAMQVAAVNPLYISREQVPGDYVAHETEILKAQAVNEEPNKPIEIIEKMIVGRVNKQLKEICLVDQDYVKAENKENVGQYVANAGKAAGAVVSIKNFVRFETGEGIEKKTEDFAAEVAKQMENK